MGGRRVGRWKKFVVCWLIVAMLAQLAPNLGYSDAAAKAALADMIAAAEPAAGKSESREMADISGHWAETEIRAWLREGLVKGLPTGEFRPDGKVARAELAAMINRAFGYTEEAAGSFPDVPRAKWYAADAARAKAAGYMQGDKDGKFRPEASVTRGEAAVIAARLLKLNAGGGESAAGKFADAKDIPTWSRDAVGAVFVAGLMKGQDGNRFSAGGQLTRAEAVVLLDRASKLAGADAVEGEIPSSIGKTGTYGPASGTVVHEGDLAINVPDVVLRNVKITGSLLLGEGIGEGDVTLDRVVVDGATTIKGGGRNSVHVLDSTLTRVFITKVDGQVRVVIEGSTAVDQVTVQSGATLQVASGSGASYGTVTVSTTGDVTLDGDFPNVVLVAAAQLTVASGKVDNMTLTNQAAGANVTLNKNVQVTTVNADASASIKGDGAIGTASVTATGVTIAQKPTQTIVADGVSANVGGTVTTGAGSGPGSGSGSGPGSGGSSGVVRVSAAIGSVTAAGFELRLAPAVPNLTIADIVMVNGDGMPALVSRVSSVDGGSTYRATGFLTGGATYSLSLAKPGYAFGAGLSVVVPDVPVVTGALVAPDPMKLVLLFNKQLAALPDAPAGFSVTYGGGAVEIASATLTASGSRIELALRSAVAPATLELRYTPGTIRSVDGKALPALVQGAFAGGSTPSGRAAYDKMLGMTAAQAATDLKDNVGVSAPDASKALIEGGYNTNALVKALNTVYGISNENMPNMLLPNGISVYHLLIGMKEAGILNVANLGKNFSTLNGASDDWVRARSSRWGIPMRRSCSTAGSTPTRSWRLRCGRTTA
ncbi:S-layer homology domain-containing protein [Cohnella sp. GCM10027633]|uniref:S-layer homology domain-containing protein n=1 Tax=unclassified Cohnella TaxID=2636738 RepID=UPI003636443B